MEFGCDAVVTDLLSDETALVVDPGGGGEDGLERSGRDRGLGVGRPGEEHISEVKDEGRCFGEGHGYEPEGEEVREGRGPIEKMRGKSRNTL